MNAEHTIRGVHQDVLRTQLDSCPAGFVSKLLDGITAIVIKDADTDAWKVYANGDSETCWQDLGFASPPCDEAPRHRDAE